jgi:hypothetical protein
MLYRWILPVLRWIGSLLTGNCTKVSTFSDIIEAVASAQNNMVRLCSFTIDKPSDSTLILTKDVKMTCSVKHLCVLRGSGNHIPVQGSQSRLRISKFIFNGATNRVIQIDASAIHSSNQGHEIRECVFEQNAAALSPRQLGGSIVMEACPPWWRSLCHIDSRKYEYDQYCLC